MKKQLIVLTALLAVGSSQCMSGLKSKASSLFSSAKEKASAALSGAKTAVGTTFQSEQARNMMKSAQEMAKAAIDTEKAKEAMNRAQQAAALAMSGDVKGAFAAGKSAAGSALGAAKEAGRNVIALADTKEGKELIAAGMQLGKSTTENTVAYTKQLLADKKLVGDASNYKQNYNAQNQQYLQAKGQQVEFEHHLLSKEDRAYLQSLVDYWSKQ